MSHSDHIRQAFLKDLASLRTKYPMVLLTYWTPGDCMDAISEDPTGDADWTEPHWPAVVERLARSYNVSEREWEWVADAAREVLGLPPGFMIEADEESEE